MADMTLHPDPTNWGTPFLEINDLFNEFLRGRF
jgi:hypothetical protein